MINPSYHELMRIANADVEPGEAPIVQSRYSIVIAAAKRARQLIDGAPALVDGGIEKPLSEAVEELYEGKVKILSEGSSEEDEPETEHREGFEADPELDDEESEESEEDEDSEEAEED